MGHNLERRIAGVLLTVLGGAMALLCALHLSSHTYKAMSLFEFIYLDLGVLLGVVLMVGGVAMLITRRSPEYITDPPRRFLHRTKEDLLEIRSKR